MPNFNRLAARYSLLSQYYGVTHPSLPNYLALIGGDIFGIHRNCEDCFVDQPKLADLIEQSGRTWKTYQEGLPAPCFMGSRGDYAQKHNPFIYFDSIRLNEARCQAHVVGLDQLSTDLAADALPNFAFITPDLCHSGHDCDRIQVDTWLSGLVDQLQASPALGQNSLIAITFDEASGDDQSTCCGLPPPGGGRVATVLISPLVRESFVDNTPYSHYSLLKTIAQAWGLPLIGRAADPQTNAILAPFQPPLAVEGTLVGAGDIDVCGENGDEATAALLENIPGPIFTLGDNSNEVGTLKQYENCFGATWGRFKERIHPSPGNHDFTTDNGADYFTYFGAAAGEPGKGYYSYDLGTWHILALNGNCSQVGGCGEGSPQLDWLRADLAASPARCTIAYWHQPRFSSGIHGSNREYVDFWRALYAAGAEIVMNGHDHIYERFAPQDPDGNADPLNGIRQFIVGTGGAFYRDLGGDPIPNSEKIILYTFGALKLTLRDGSYDWQFIPVDGRTESDSGSGTCH
ncbi:MAG TPA: alkaline phosphatase family protein, partial [Anaerolinea sp.]|nr:alkaline phosphatase family protein [Anaerolinea sp.]